MVDHVILSSITNVNYYVASRLLAQSLQNRYRLKALRKPYLTRPTARSRTLLRGRSGCGK
jgi:hypothetical protein